MQPFPKNIKETTESNTEALLQISRIREEDVRDRNNFPNVFALGRKVGKIPSGSADIAVTDRIGDFNYDADYYYLCVNDSGAAWRRIGLASW